MHKRKMGQSAMGRCLLCSAALLAMLAASCAGDAKVAIMDVQGQAMDDGTSPAMLDNALREIAALDTPKGVDNDVFAELKAELAGLLAVPQGTVQQEAAARSSSAVYDPDAYDMDSSYMSAFLDKGRLVGYGGGKFLPVLVPGDFDRNGVVNVNDLVPLGRNFGRVIHRGSGDYLLAIDYDGNSLINSADLTGIARNFGRHVSGMKLYRSMDVRDYPWLLTEGDRIEASLILPASEFRPGSQQALPGYSLELDDLAAGEFFWGRPLLSDGEQAVSWPRRAALADWQQFELQLCYEDGVVDCLEFSPADHDRNGLVTMADLSPLYYTLNRAMAYADAGQPIPDVLDRNLDGHLGHADGVISILEIGMYLNRHTGSFRAYWTDNSALVPKAGMPTLQHQSINMLTLTRMTEFNYAIPRLESEMVDIPSGSYLWVENQLIRSEVIQIP